MLRLATIRNHVAASVGEVETAAPVITDALGVPVADTKTDPAFAWTKKIRGVLWEKYDGDLQEADAEISKLGSPFSGAGYQGVQKLAEEYDPGRNRWGVQGAHLNPLGLFLEPPGPLLTHLHGSYKDRLSPLAERTCFSQVRSRQLHGAAVQHGVGQVRRLHNPYLSLSELHYERYGL
jgi:hypothetical protein